VIISDVSFLTSKLGQINPVPKVVLSPLGKQDQAWSWVEAKSW